MTLRLAMWSGPRNISTAMMRAFENRPDTCVVDEPFYACYLAATGIDHPMREAVLKSQSQSWAEVAEALASGAVPADVYYQKHMTHHMLDGTDLEWTRSLQHCFLIRDPRFVVRSYGIKRNHVSVEDIGIKRQAELYDALTRITGQTIPVIDSARFLADPGQALQSLCARFGLAFDAAMLSWPPGRRDSDGVWAPHWYQAVEASTGFVAANADEPVLTAAQQRVADASMPWYEQLLRRA